MSNATPKAKRMDLAFAALLSKDDEAILNALIRIEQEGDARAIRPLLTALLNTNDGRIQQRIMALLHDVKAPNAADELFLALEDPAFKSIRSTILGTFWNAGIDVREHLDRFVRVAIEGSAAECFECLTVVENQEIWPEKAARHALNQVRKAVSAEKDAYKASMLNDLEAVLAYRLGNDE
ncbi:MAG: hypothetical protein JNM62_11265 [Flavobacteriales bacterium]|nr:hypothetical protein [Flavobacteriales bacterium]